jgi:hypothetical protein
VTDDINAVLAIGSRVRVRRDPTFPGPWPAEPLGTIVPRPAELGTIDLTTAGGELFRIVEHLSGPQRHYLVEFDEPHLDTDGPGGGGPDHMADVWEGDLELRNRLSRADRHRGPRGAPSQYEER